MKALLIIAHGSRSQAANDEVEQLAQSIAGNMEAVVDRTVHAFLEIAAPRAAAAIKGLAEEGVTEIRILPYFLAGGTHVANDIPGLIADARESFPHVRFELLPHLGALDGIPDLILRHIRASAPID